MRNCTCFRSLNCSHDATSSCLCIFWQYFEPIEFRYTMVYVLLLMCQGCSWCCGKARAEMWILRCHSSDLKSLTTNRQTPLSGSGSSPLRISLSCRFSRVKVNGGRAVLTGTRRPGREWGCSKALTTRCDHLWHKKEVKANANCNHTPACY